MHIQVMKIFKLSFRNAWEHKLEWLRVVFAPLVIWTLGVLFMCFVFWTIGYPLAFHQAIFGQTPFKIDQLPSTNILVSGSLAKLVYEVAYWLAIISLIINGFRYAVLQEVGKNWWLLHLNKRFGKMLVYMFLIFAVLGIYSAIGVGVVMGVHFLLTNMALDVALGALFILSGFYLFLRVSLYSLLIAIDKTQSIRTSWHLLKGNVLRLAGLTLLIAAVAVGLLAVGTLALGLFGMLLELINPVLKMGIEVLFVFWGVLMWLDFWVVWTKAFSLVYQTLAERKAL